MYETGDGHVEVLTASVRNLNHFLAALHLGSDIITAPLKILKEWAESGMKAPDGVAGKANALQPISYEEIDLMKDWRSFNTEHILTAQGIAKFVADWNGLIG